MNTYSKPIVAGAVAAGLLGAMFGAATAADKTSEMKSYVASAKEKTKEVAEKAKEKAVEAKDKIAAKLHRGDKTAEQGDVRAAQRRLAELGYNTGPADGVAGPKTHAGVADFQRDHALPVTGRLDHATWAALNESSGSASASPATRAPEDRPGMPRQSP